MNAKTAMGIEPGVSGLRFKVAGSKLGTWNFGPGTYARQDGAALPVGLVFLLVLTIFGISSMSTTLLEEKMSANVQEQNRSFQSAETGATRKFTEIVQTIGDTANLGVKGDCDTTSGTASDANDTTPECTVTDFGETQGGSRGGGAFSGNDLTPSDLSDPGSYLNRGAASPYGSSHFHYRIASEAVNPAKAKAAVNLGVAIARPGTD